MPWVWSVGGNEPGERNVTSIILYAIWRDRTVLERILVAVVAVMLLVGVAVAGDKAKASPTDKQNKEVADTIIALKAEVLNWQKKYYVEKSTRLQLQAMNNLCTTPEFIDNYGLILETDKKLKQTQLVGGEIK